MKNLEKKAVILKIQSEIRKVLGDELRKKEFIELSPVILSPITDPLNHPTAPASILYYGENYHITQSMIFHKQIAVKTLERIFVFSPNVRLETQEKRETGRHLVEFTQLDLEVKNAKREDMMRLCEALLVATLKHMKKKCAKELELLGRAIAIPKIPFQQIPYKEAYEKYGEEFEAIISKNHMEPVWIIDIPLQKREFYDKEDPKNPGYLRDMDLLYPEGYGEALSGGEREYIYTNILQRIKWKGQKPSQFHDYLHIARTNLPPSAGFGIGIERLTRYICGLKRIEDTTLFPKIPGKYCI